MVLYCVTNARLHVVVAPAPEFVMISRSIWSAISTDDIAADAVYVEVPPVGISTILSESQDEEPAVMPLIAARYTRVAVTK